MTGDGKRDLWCHGECQKETPHVNVQKREHDGKCARHIVADCAVCGFHDGFVVYEEPPDAPR